jgi:hypothetical protein
MPVLLPIICGEPDILLGVVDILQGNRNKIQDITQARMKVAGTMKTETT